MKLWPSTYCYDVFVIHDVADRETITRKLCDGLEKAGLRIWYSGKDLGVGCYLHEEIMRGLAKSRYGIVILSKNSISSNWLAIELYELLARAINRRQKTVLPVLHCISMEELKKLIIVPDNIWSITSSCMDIDTTIQKLTKEIKSEPVNLKEWANENNYALKIWSSIAALFLALGIVYLYYCGLHPSNAIVEEKINMRIANFRNQILRERELVKRKTKSVSIDTISALYSDFMNLKCLYRNEYEFTNGMQTIRSRTGVEQALGVNPASLSPSTIYSLVNPQIYYSDSIYANKMVHSVTYFLFNSQPISYRIAGIRRTGDGECEVEVNYAENILYVKVNLFYPPGKNMPKKHQMAMKGFLPGEKYIFEKTGDEWKLKAIE